MHIKSATLALFAASFFAMPASATIVTYTSSADFVAATQSLTTEGFDGITTPKLNGIGYQPYNTTFSRNGVTIVDTSLNANPLSVLDNTYLNGGNQVRNRYSAANGAILDASYGNLTITFDTPVTAFAIDYAAVARGITGSASNSFDFALDGVAAATGSYSGSHGFAFFGVTSDTPFTTVTITLGSNQINDEFDNIRYGVATPAPEPATLSLLGAGLAGFSALRRRKAKA